MARDFYSARLFHQIMGSLKARSLLWVLVVLAACSVLMRLGREDPPADSTVVGRGNSAAAMLEAVEFIFRLGFVGSEPASEETPKTHPPECICAQFFFPQFEVSCYAPAPVRVESQNGELLGFRMTGKSMEHPLYKMGLKSGDLLTRVNGEPLTPEAISKFYTVFRSEHAARFDIVREGKNLTLETRLLDDGRFKVEVLQSLPLTTILDNPSEFAGKGFTTRPVLENGDPIGMRIRLSNPQHPLAKLGLRDQDIVQSVNGHSIHGPGSLSTIYRTVRTSNILEFDIIRNGQPRSVVLSLEE